MSIAIRPGSRALTCTPPSSTKRAVSSTISDSTFNIFVKSRALGYANRTFGSMVRGITVLKLPPYYVSRLLLQRLISSITHL